MCQRLLTPNLKCSLQIFTPSKFNTNAFKAFFHTVTTKSGNILYYIFQQNKTKKNKHSTKDKAGENFDK